MSTKMINASELDFNIVQDSITDVVIRYLLFLTQIQLRIEDEGSENEQTDKNRFLTIRNELQQFLIDHSGFVEINEMKLNGRTCARFAVDSSTSYEDMSQIDTFISLTIASEDWMQIEWDFDFEVFNYNVVETIKDKLKKDSISNEDVVFFFRNHLLTEVNENYATYKQCEDQIVERADFFVYNEARSANVLKNRDLNSQSL